MVSLVQKQKGHHLVEVEVVMDRDAIIELEPDVRVGEVAQLLHGTQEWDGHLAEVDCLMSTRRSVVNVVQDCENGRATVATRGGAKEGEGGAETAAGAVGQVPDPVPGRSPEGGESATAEGPG